MNIRTGMTASTGLGHAGGYVYNYRCQRISLDDDFVLWDDKEGAQHM
jgi:hypothetical protein